MPKITRRQLITFATAMLPAFLVRQGSSAQAVSTGVKVAKSADIKVGQTKIYTGTSSSGATVEVVLTRTKKGLFALDGTCTHQGCGVGAQGTKLVCPCHGSVFAPDTGACIMGPNGAPKNSLKPLSKYKATEKGGFIYVV